MWGRHIVVCVEAQGRATTVPWLGAGNGAATGKASFKEKARELGSLATACFADNHDGAVLLHQLDETCPCGPCRQFGAFGINLGTFCG